MGLRGLRRRRGQEASQSRLGCGSGRRAPGAEAQWHSLSAGAIGNLAPVRAEAPVFVGGYNYSRGSSALVEAAEPKLLDYLRRSVSPPC